MICVHCSIFYVTCHTVVIQQRIHGFAYVEALIEQFIDSILLSLVVYNRSTIPLVFASCCFQLHSSSKYGTFSSCNNYLDYFDYDLCNKIACYLIQIWGKKPSHIKKKLDYAVKTQFNNNSLLLILMWRWSRTLFSCSQRYYYNTFNKSNRRVCIAALYGDVDQRGMKTGDA